MVEYDITVPVEVEDRFRALVTGPSIGGTRSDWFGSYEEAEAAGLELAAGMLSHLRLTPRPSVAVNAHTHGFDGALLQEDPAYHVTIEKVKEVR